MVAQPEQAIKVSRTGNVRVRHAVYETGDDRPPAGQVRLDHARRDRLVQERARSYCPGPLADLAHAVTCAPDLLRFGLLCHDF